MRTPGECAVFAWTHLASRLVSTFSRLHNSLPARCWYIVVGPKTYLKNTHTWYTKAQVLAGHCPVLLCVKVAEVDQVRWFIILWSRLGLLSWEREKIDRLGYFNRLCAREYSSNVGNVNERPVCTNSHADFSLKLVLQERYVNGQESHH